MGNVSLVARLFCTADSTEAWKSEMNSVPSIKCRCLHVRHIPIIPIIPISNYIESTFCLE